MTTMLSNNYFNTNEAAEELGITVDRLRYLARNKLIESESVGTRGPRLFKKNHIIQCKEKNIK